MTVITGGVIIPGGTRGYTSPGAPTNGTNEVQRITITGSPNGGGFYLKIAPFETALIAYNASAAAVKTALQLLPNIAAAEVLWGADCVDTSGGALPGSTVDVEFKNGFGVSNVGQMTVRSALTGGSAPTIAITTPTPGVDATYRDAGIGATLVRQDNGAIYQNISATLGLPDWELMGTVTNGSVDTAQLAPGAVTSTIIDDATIAPADLAATIVDDSTIELSGDLHVKDGGITAAKLAAALAGTADGLGLLRVAKATFDPSATAGMRTIAPHGLGVTIPDNAIVCGGFVDVVTTFADGASDNATIAISIQSADDFVAAVAISNGGNPWDSGLHAAIPKANTPELTGIKLSAAREITATVAVHALTLGKAEVYVYYLPGD